MYLAELRARRSDPALMAVVGVGRMGRGIVDQVSTMAGLVVGPILARRAREAGVVYTLAAGDQPGAIFEMAEWALSLGFRIVCAGRGTVLYPDDHHATPEKYIEIAQRNRMNPKMYNEFRDGTKSQLEMVAVSNVLKLPPAKRGMHEPFCKWQDLGTVFALR